MKFVWAIALGFILTISAATLIVYKTEYNQKEEDSLQDSLQFTQEAVSSAAGVIGEADRLFDLKSKRDKAYGQYLDTLGKNNSWHGFSEQGKYRTPIFLFADYDGFYLKYTKDGDSIKIFDTECIPYVNEYSGTIPGGYAVRFYLDDTVMVSTREPIWDPKEGKKHVYVFYGDRKDVFTEIYDALKVHDLQFLSDTPATGTPLSFEEEKTACICDAISKKINYYCNAENGFDTNKVSYSVMIPGADAQDRKTIKNPFIAAFVQYDQYRHIDGINNMYSWVACEWVKRPKYELYQNGDIATYHLKGCSCTGKGDYLEDTTDINAAAIGAQPGGCIINSFREAS